MRINYINYVLRHLTTKIFKNILPEFEVPLCHSASLVRVLVLPERQFCQKSARVPVLPERQFCQKSARVSVLPECQFCQKSARVPVFPECQFCQSASFPVLQDYFCVWYSESLDNLKHSLYNYHAYITL